MGVKKDAGLDEAVLNTWRRRRHCTSLLNAIEVELNIIAGKLNPEKGC